MARVDDDQYKTDEDSNPEDTQVASDELYDPKTEANSNQQETQVTSDELVVLWCEPCFYEYSKKIAAVSYCPTCNSILCKSCDATHTRLPSSSQHNVLRGHLLPTSNTLKPVQYSGCAIHPGNIEDFYCLSHGNVLCASCVKKFHKRCAVKGIAGLCQNLSDHDIENLRDDVQNVKDQITVVKSLLERNVEDIAIECQSLTKEADDLREIIVAKVNELFSQITTNIKEACNQHCSNHSVKISGLSNAIVSLDKNLEDIDKAARDNLSQHLFLRMQEIIKQIGHITSRIEESNKQRKTIKLSFVPSQEIANILSTLRSFGDINVQETENISTPLHVVTFPRRQIKISRLRVKKSPPLRVTATDDTKTCYITGMDMTNDGSILMADDNNKKIKLFAADRTLVTAVSLSAFPFNISVVNTKTAVVTADDQRLHFFDISNPGSLELKRSVDFGYSFLACASYKEDIIVTTNINPRTVERLDLSGQSKWSLSLNCIGQPLFEWPRAVVCSVIKGTPVAVVADSGKNTLTLVDINTAELKQIIDIHNKGPSALTVDSAGNIYAYYRETREIVIWANDLNESRILISGRDLSGKVSRLLYNKTKDEIIVSYWEEDFIDIFGISRNISS